MGEFWMFAVTVAVMCAALAVLSLLLPWADRTSLRMGLWLNGVDEREADRIIEWHEKRR